MGKKVSKATKKFQSKHLKDAIDKRRKDKQLQKRIQSRRGNKTDEEKKNAAGTKEEQKMKKSANNEVFNDMQIEQYFDKGFELPKTSKKVKNVDQRRNNSASESESESDANDIDMLGEDEEVQKYLQNETEEIFHADVPTINEKEPIKKSNSSITKSILTESVVETWEEKLTNKPNLKVIKNTIDAFQYTVEYENAPERLLNNPFHIDSDDVMQSIVRLGLEDLPKAITSLVAYKLKKGVRTLATGSNVETLSKHIQVHIISLIHLMSSLNDSDTLDVVLTSINDLLPYVVGDKKSSKKLIKQMVEIWGNSDDEYTIILIANYLIDFSTEFRSLLLQSVMKTIYSSFVSNCRKINEDSLSRILAQMKSTTDLFLVDETISYTIGFDYIKQLALHLKNSMSSNKELSMEEQANNYKSVYNWQFIMSLDFWSSVVIASYNSEDSKKDSPIKELLAPLVQTMLGTTRLIPTPQFYPLRFHIVRTLIEIIESSGALIPVYPIINEVLFSNLFFKQVRASSDNEAFDFKHNLKCPIEDINTKSYQFSVWKVSIEITLEYLLPFCKQIAFPELATPIIVALEQFKKKTEDNQYETGASNLIERIRQQIDFIDQARSTVNYNPQNTNNVLKFLSETPVEKTPLGSYIKSQLSYKFDKEFESAIDYLKENSEVDDDLELEASGEEEFEDLSEEGTSSSD
ncbi:hypothetical protein TPHA_0A01040 [Tetrapisispora phaffii CBS 4417]|uniref:Nucleolar complex protein 2 n=1 Tax=Tetrapisispora phaffii (strain ATCC 24235 / CBS 4417 / NBRC 1672 / NRRL Y-8282 / UCD 70-5) TaxID=1071381 RepID=G8BMR1_TETPH|nr:hypothetical protein TPHA_0A01040 [Tetrapisispora phaffii CBS 4417]CCE61189.1 hypothetical protein TPHA_0A01040 [Tetrapisispora phaffii CBS 4417]